MCVAANGIMVVNVTMVLLRVVCSSGNSCNCNCHSGGDSNSSNNCWL
jgi:hypothetical protein